MLLQEKINQAEVVSFDIFDTLIIRIYSEPVQLFYHLEEISDRRGFCEARIKAEATAREKAIAQKKLEVTLEEIYGEIDKSYCDLMEQELSLELFACRADAEMKAVYEETLKSKRIFITSDMYLPIDIIEKILLKEGFSGYEKILLSSDQLKTKADGSLYDELISCAQVSSEKILHIGDHEYTDIRVAQRKKIKTHHYVNNKIAECQLKNSQFFTTVKKYNQKNAALAVLPSLIKERETVKPEDYWYHFGFQYLGMLSLGYVRWLKEQFEKDGITKAFFMLRDGYIFQKVFERLFPEFPSENIYGSRRMFLFAGMENYEDIKFHTIGIHTAGLTYNSFWTRLCIEDEELFQKFESRFPNQNKTIATAKELSDIGTFLKENEDAFIAIGKTEREYLLDYFEQIGILQEKAAVVDLGWKASMLRGIEKACQLGSVNTNIVGYYIGTHGTTEGLNVKTYALENASARDYEIADILNNKYVISILELAFSAPHPSILKLKKKQKVYQPIYQNACDEEKKRMDACERMLHGIMDFVDAFESISAQYPIKIDLNAALVPLEYLARHISAYDKMKIFEMSFFPGIGADDTHYPISPNGMVNIGFINPWPGDVSAEFEVLERIKKAAADIGVRCTLLDDFGHILNEKQEKTAELVSPNALDFVVTTHYETHKSVDSFYYHTLWNPPEIPLNLDYYYDKVTNHYIINDDYLIYDSGGMTNHLKSMLLRKKRTLEGASRLTASCPGSSMLEPDLSDPIMFYCGMNWEKAIHNSNRHEGLFKRLDDTKKVRFYGPEKVDAWGGIRPWKGYKCYRGSISFDGHSILKEINRCGVCLVLSSDIHRRAGAVTNRAYEACAAGAIMISDNNEFMKRWFKDAALFIDYNTNDSRDTFNQIMEKYNWVKEHQKEAEDIIKRAQKIFQEHFALDKQLLALINNHAKRFRVIEKDLFATNESKRVLVTYVITTQDTDKAFRFLEQVINNIENQYYRNIVLGVACDISIYGEINLYVNSRTSRACVYPMGIFDFKGTQILTTAECTNYLCNVSDYDYFMSTTANETWFYDHVTSLVRTIEDDNVIAAYSGRLLMDSGYRREDSFRPVTVNTVYYMQPPDWLPGPGQVLFHKRAEEVLKEYMLPYLDGYEYYAILALCKLKFKEQFSFSRRMTFVYEIDLPDKKNSLLEADYQIRFIRDLVNEEYSESVNGNMSDTKMTRRQVNLTLAKLPLKLWIKLRIYNARARRADSSTEKGKRIIREYNNILERFLDA